MRPTTTTTTNEQQYYSAQRQKILFLGFFRGCIYVCIHALDPARLEIKSIHRTNIFCIPLYTANCSSKSRSGIKIYIIYDTKNILV